MLAESRKCLIGFSFNRFPDMTGNMVFKSLTGWKVVFALGTLIWEGHSDRLYILWEN